MLTPRQLQIITKIFNSSGQISKAWVFGCVARGEENPDSDIDILFVPDRSVRPFGFYQMIAINDALEEQLQKKVDFIPESSLKEDIRPYANQGRILIYERS